jgi:acetylornithine deacetylase/succinyl-diaminopimelate desuccinylase-like protein
METQATRVTAASLMPGIIADLKRLVGHASVAFPGFPAEPVHAMARDVLALFKDAGVANAGLLDLGAGYPAVYGEIPAPPGAPTVLLYAHYDVQPAPVEQGWETDAWTATEGSDGRIYGRGAADDKSGIVTHVGTLRAFGGKPPVGVKILIEGEEETVSHLEAYVEAHPSMFGCDAFVIADMGNVHVGEPALTTALRGDVACTVTVSTLQTAVHSGLFGGAAPDALIALIRILSTLHTPDGDVAVPGLHSAEWPGTDFPEGDFRAAAGVLDGVDLTGTGTVASRLWSKPSVTAIGLDAPATATAANVLIPTATAKLSMRVVPGCDPDRELDLLMEHLKANAPGNVKVEVKPVKVGHPFQVAMNGPALDAARSAMSEAFGKQAAVIGSGGSIPLVASLKKAAPAAAVILWGAEDLARARIHAPNESVDPREIERIIDAQVLMLSRLANS